MFIPILTFQIPHVNTTMHAYTVFTVLIVGYIPTTKFILNPHYIFEKQ